jgi:hypothetical protein
VVCVERGTQRRCTFFVSGFKFQVMDLLHKVSRSFTQSCTEFFEVVCVERITQRRCTFFVSGFRFQVSGLWLIFVIELVLEKL